jgi:hypothetical protein
MSLSNLFPDLIGVFVMMMCQPTTYFSLIFMLFLTTTVDKISNFIVNFLIELHDKKEEERLLKEKGFYEGI